LFNVGIILHKKRLSPKRENSPEKASLSGMHRENKLLYSAASLRRYYPVQVPGVFRQARNLRKRPPPATDKSHTRPAGYAKNNFIEKLSGLSVKRTFRFTDKDFSFSNIFLLSKNICSRRILLNIFI